MTVPVGVPLPGEAALTVAEKVTLCPQTAGLADAVTATELDAWFTTCGEPESLPLLDRKLPSPLEAAVVVWGAAVRRDVVNVAWADALSATVLASVVAPSLNVTLPLGAPAPGETALTVAVNVTT